MRLIVVVNRYKEFDNLLPAGEYEGLHADQGTNKLYALCKQCAGDKHEKECSGLYSMYQPTVQLQTL